MEYRKNLCSVTILPRAIYNSPFATSVFLLTVFELELSVVILPLNFSDSPYGSPVETVPHAQWVWSYFAGDLMTLERISSRCGRHIKYVTF